MLPWHVNAVGFTNRAVLIAGQRKVEFTEAALPFGSRDPALMRGDWVGAHGQHVAVAAAKLLDARTEGGQLRRAHQGKVAWIKHQDQPAVLVIAERNLLRT